MANLSPISQGFVADALTNTFNEHGRPDPLKEPGMPLAASFGQPEPDNSFAQQFFGVNDASDLLEEVGPNPSNPEKMLWKFKNDGQVYSANKDKDPAQVLENIWDARSPGLWGAAKGSTLYNLPADFSSALAYGLDGVGLEDMSKDWRDYGDKLREEYHKNYGQFMTPGLEEAWDQGKMYDFALHTIGSMSPYMGLALAGGGAGAAAALRLGGGAALGSFVGAAGITAPITIAQFADRQVAEMTEAGVENPYDNIDWIKASVLGTVASGLQALPVQSILYSGPVLKALESWGVKLGTSTSARMLGSIADVAGTNALVGLGVSGLSRLNADLPLLDDEAKQEYLESAVMGSLVGVPFGAYKGYKYRPPAPDAPPVDHVADLKDTATSDLMKKYKAPDEDIIYGQAPEEQKLLPWNKKVIHNPYETYGINDVMDATEYLMNIKYKGPQGQDLDGYSTLLQHYANKEKAPTDVEIINAARKAKRVRELHNSVLNTPDGILFPDIESQPQVHGHTPEILTKAAALTDRFGYDDAFVRNLSDKIVTKLYDMNIDKELRKNGGDKYPPEVFQKVMEQLKNFVDEQVVKDTEQYGSLYKRPEAQRRIGLTTEERRNLVNRNPRKDLAEMLMRKRREEAGRKQYEAFLGDQDPVPIKQPDLTKPPPFIEEPPVDGEAFGPYAGLRQEPMGPRGLLPPPSPFKGMKVGDSVNITVNGAQVNPKPVKITKLIDDPKRGKYVFTEGSKAGVPLENVDLVQPFNGVSPKTVVDALHKAGTMPGDRVTQRMSKKELLDFLTNSPWAQTMMKYHNLKTVGELAAVIRKGKALLLEEQRKAARALLKGPKPDGQPFRPSAKNKAKFKEEPFAIDKEVSKLVDEAKEAIRKIVAERNEKILKDHPEMGPAMNEMFKRFAELEGESALLKDGPTTTVFKGKHSFVESITNRLKVLKAMEEVFKHIDPAAGKVFVEAFNNMLVGKDTSLNDVNMVMSSLKMAFGLNAEGGMRDISDAAIGNWYKSMRERLHPKTLESLEKSRNFLTSYMEDKHGMNKKDFDSISSADIETEMFTNYMKGRLKVDLDKFNESKQAKMFKQFRNALKKAGKELNDIEFKSVDDLFEYNKASTGSIPRDARKPGAFARVVEKELNNDKKAEKVQEDLGRAEQKGHEDNVAVPPGGFGKPPKGASNTNDPFLNNSGNNIGNIHAGFSFFQSIPYLARKIPFVGRLHNHFKEQQDISASIDMSFARKFHEFFTKQANGDRKVLYEAMDIIDRARNSDQQLLKNDKGLLVLKDENGVETIFDRNMTDLIFAVDDYFKEGPRQALKIQRQFLKQVFEHEGLDENSSLEHVRRVLEKLTDKIEGNPLPELRAGYIRDRKALQELYDAIKISEAQVKNTNAYIPHYRRGDYVINITDKATGKIVHFETIANTNIFGLEDGKLPSEKFIRQKMHELGLYKKFDPKEYDFDHHALTYNNAAKYINQGLVSTELIQGLMASGIDRHMKLADHLATGIEDPVKMMKDWAANVNTNKSNILKYVLARGIGKHSLKSDNIPGYDKDWMWVIENYKNTHRSSLSRMAVAMKLAEAQKEMHLGRGSAKDLSTPARRISENYIDYMNTPATDYAGIRSFNFLWTMGYRVSPALLQLVSLGTQIPALALENNMNIVNVMSRLGSAMRQAKDFGRSVEGYSPEDQAFMKKHPFFFNESIASDFIDREMSTAYTKGYGPTAEKAELITNKVIKNAGVFISAAETFTRRTAWSMYKNMYKEMPETLESALKTEKNNSDWQNFWNTYKDTMSVEEAMATYKMTLAHAVFGKTGRGPMQRGLAGAVLFPFMTYPQQMLELLFEQMTGKRGINGVAAGLYTTSAYVAIAGLAGIPAYELLKTMYEKYEEKVNGRTIDLNMQLQHEGVPRWLRKGLVSDATGVDISQRMAQDIIGQHILVGLLKGNIQIGELGGVPGRTLGNLLEATGEALSPNSDKGPLELAAKVAPAVVADYAKAFQLASGDAESVLKTSSGKILKDPADVNALDIASRTLGFTTLEQTESRERLFYQQRANQEFNQWKSRLAEATATAKYKMHLGTLQGDNEKYQEGRDALDEISQDLRRFARKNKIQLDNDFWNSYKKSVAERLWQKKNPGKIKKPTKREKVYLDILEEE